MHASLLLALLATGCSSSAADQPAPDPRPVVARVAAVLEEACRLDSAGQEDESRAAWGRAHALYDRDLAPQIARSQGERAATRADYRFAMVRGALDAQGGAPEVAVQALVQELEQLIDAPPAESGR